MFVDRVLAGAADLVAAKIAARRQRGKGYLKHADNFITRAERWERRFGARTVEARNASAERRRHLVEARRALDLVNVLLAEIAAGNDDIEASSRAAFHAVHVGRHVSRYEAYFSPSSRFGTRKRESSFTREAVVKALKGRTHMAAADLLEISVKHLRTLRRRFDLP
jgi:hypothetical protein